MVTDPEHATQTQKSKYRYIFSSKHHGGGSATDACWAKDIRRDDEFSVFDAADLHSISDDRGWLYGVLPGAEEKLRDLGTWQQQIAEFPAANANVPWHGYPLWAVNEVGPTNRANQKMRPSKEVFQKMEDAGLISARQRKRLYKGDHA